MESEAAAADRGATDRAIVAVLFQGGLRRSEAAALRWADGRGIVVYVRRSKTDQDGTAADVRYGTVSSRADGGADAFACRSPALLPSSPRSGWLRSSSRGIGWRGTGLRLSGQLWSDWLRSDLRLPGTLC